VRTIINVRTIIFIMCLGALLWAGSASAEKQKQYFLKVSIHKDVQPRMTKAEVESLLQRVSSKVLSSCNVRLRLDGKIQTFSSAPSDIKNSKDLEAVHRVPAHIKVVQTISSCIGRPPFSGCSFRPDTSFRKTMIVTRDPPLVDDERPLLWAHEFGHTKGLFHRIDDELALMTPCEIKVFNKNLTKDECTCFRKGPKGCPIPEPTPQVSCPAQPQ
jgi:hypothetical protein